MKKKGHDIVGKKISGIVVEDDVKKLVSSSGSDNRLYGAVSHPKFNENNE